MPCKSKAKRLEYDKRYRQEHKEERAAHAREYRRAHPEARAKTVERQRQRRKTSEYRAYMKANAQNIYLRRKRNREKLKIEVFMHYSNNKMECARCGYNNIDALCIDHIHNNGCYERKVFKISGGDKFYRWLKKRGFPSGYQILCFNCNQLKQVEHLRNQGKGQVFVQQRI